MELAVGALLGKWVLSAWFIRLYWRLNLSTVYGFLGQRIGPRTQHIAAWAFLGGRFISTGVRLFIAAIAFAAVTGSNLYVGVLVMAVVSTVFTLFGGLRAVVWTDVAQGILILIGAGAALVVGLSKIGLPLGDLDPARPSRTEDSSSSRSPLRGDQRLQRGPVALFGSSVPGCRARRLPARSRDPRHRSGERPAAAQHPVGEVVWAVDHSLGTLHVPDRHALPLLRNDALALQPARRASARRGVGLDRRESRSCFPTSS